VGGPHRVTQGGADKGGAGGWAGDRVTKGTLMGINMIIRISVEVGYIYTHMSGVYIHTREWGIYTYT
jgi:hypothetical protein